MDMTTLRLATREGDRVRHVPVVACGNADDERCQDGTITRFTDTQVLVKLDVSVEHSGWYAAPEAACDAELLRVL